MDLSPRRFADTIVLSLSGRIDHSQSEALREAMAPHLARCTAALDRMVLDLSGLEYISSAGLRVLMLAQKQAKSQGGTLVVAALQPMIREIFEISRFSMIFDAFASVREALVRVSTLAVTAFDAA